MIYMVGSNLESQGAAATMDILEMASSGVDQEFVCQIVVKDTFGNASASELKELPETVGSMSVTEIEDYAFAGMPFTEFTVDATNETHSAKEAFLMNKHGDVLITEVVFPDSLQHMQGSMPLADVRNNLHLH